jgi:hypothetical protein
MRARPVRICTTSQQAYIFMKCGNTKDAFLRDTIAPLITEETQIYKDLETEIFC